MQLLQQVPKLTSTTVTEGNKTVTTTVESPELEKQKLMQLQKVWPLQKKLKKSNHLSQQQKQIIKLKQLKSTQSLKTTKGKAEYEAKSQEITLIEKRNAEAEADYQETSEEDYNTQQAAYKAALEEYKLKGSLWPK